MTTPNVSEVGRNEPCPCGSGKKYKRCHGLEAAPKTSVPAAHAGAGSANALDPQNQAMLQKMSKSVPGLAGFDPSQVNPDTMKEVMNLFQRLPRAQMIKLQGLMQKAMKGEDVTREAAELERMLPPNVKNLLNSFNMAAAFAANQQQADMTPEQARQVIEDAVKAGKISKEQAAELLAGAPTGASAASGTEEKKSGLSKLWSKVTGK